MNMFQNIKEKIEERKIEPSAESWSQLEMMLDAASEKPKTVSYTKWIWMAASIIILIVGAVTIISQNNSQTVVTTTINDEKEELIQENENALENRQDSVIKEDENPIATAENIILEEKKSVTEKTIPQEKSSIKNVITVVDSSKNRVKPIEKPSMKETLTEVVTVQKENPVIAQKTPIVTVNPTKLLSQTEKELKYKNKPTFKEKLNEAVATNYEELKEFFNAKKEKTN